MDVSKIMGPVSVGVHTVRYSSRIGLFNPIFIIYKKVKVKFSLCFNWAPRHEGVLGYSSTHTLISTLNWGKWSASHPGRFTPKEWALGMHCIWGWVGPRAVLDAVVQRKIPSPRRESNPRTPIVQPVAQRYTDWATTALPHIYIYIYILCACARARMSHCSLTVDTLSSLTQ
jgi:hypothetical protein